MNDDARDALIAELIASTATLANSVKATQDVLSLIVQRALGHSPEARAAFSQAVAEIRHDTDIEATAEFLALAELLLEDRAMLSVRRPAPAVQPTARQFLTLIRGGREP